MITQKEMAKYLLSLTDTWADVSSEEDIIIYKIGDEGTSDSKIFAVIKNNSQPLKIDLRCDPGLAQHLRQKYETVMPSKRLNPKNWNTIVCNGQLSDDEIKDLGRLSYRLTTSGI